MSENQNNNIEENTEEIENAEVEIAEVEIVEVTEPEPEAEPVIEIEPEEDIDEPAEPVEIEVKNKKSSFRHSIFGSAVILGIISVVTVLAISVLNLLTSPVIEKKLTDEKNESIKNFFGGEVYSEILTGFEIPAPATEAMAVYDNLTKELAGYCVTVEPKGFGGKIIMLVAVNPNITVRDTQILSMSETAGYGSRINSEKENWFREQFIYRTQDIKDIRNAPQPGENSIQIIAGATVSSKAFLNGVNAALDVAGTISGQIITELPEDEAEAYETEEEEN